MIDEKAFKNLIEQYKQDLPKRLSNGELFKWKAIKHFQDNWDIEAVDFAKMFNESFSRTGSLLKQPHYLPLVALEDFVKYNQETVRKMFRELFDESLNLYKRIKNFQDNSEALLKSVYGDANKSTYQTENAITTYLWLRYPDKYYIYKITLIQSASQELNSDYIFPNKEYEANINNQIKFYDEINVALKNEKELIDIVKHQLTSDCYPDSELKTLTIDFCHYIHTSNATNRQCNYYWLNAAYEMWQIDDFKEGESQEYTLKNENGNSRQDASAFRNIRPGDVLIAVQTYRGCSGKTKWDNEIKGLFVLSKSSDGQTIKFVIKEKLNTSVSVSMVKDLVEQNSSNIISKKGNLRTASLIKLDRSIGESIIKVISRENGIDFMEKLNLDNEEIDNEFGLTINNDLKKYQGKNTIIYGGPGCGKSYKIEKMLNNIPDEYKTKILFYPDYTHSDFVGQILPESNNGHIYYNFTPGPFTLLLEKAMDKKNCNNNYYLVIDEINRGNAPAIFGNLFQLLDRKNGKGESVYQVYDGDVLNYLKKHNIIEKSVNGIKLPSNFTIIATMNTCDQNVFTLDTAFKRRFTMEHFKSNDEGYLSKPIADTGVEWRTARGKLNDLMQTKLGNMINVDDKKLGVYFVNEEDLSDLGSFVEKVFVYIWDDVARLYRNKFFDGEVNVESRDQLLDYFNNKENFKLFFNEQ